MVLRATIQCTGFKILLKFKKRREIHTGERKKGKEEQGGDTNLVNSRQRDTIALPGHHTTLQYKYRECQSNKRENRPGGGSREASWSSFVRRFIVGLFITIFLSARSFESVEDD